MNIEKKHIVWIFDAAIEHFANRINEIELEMIRMNTFIKEPNYSKYNDSVMGTRAERLEKLKESHATNAAILKFCKESKEKASESMMKDDAEMFAEMFKRNKK